MIDKPTDDIRQEPYSLSSGFKWDTLDIRDPFIVSYGAGVIDKPTDIIR